MFNVSPELLDLSEVGLPTWEFLIAEFLYACRLRPGAHQALIAFGDSPLGGVRQRLLSIACRMTRFLPKGSEIRNLCEQDWHNLHRFALEQVYRNVALTDADEKSASWVFRQHHQLPCTAATLEARVALVKRHVPPDRPVLVIGDDDMQSLRLAEEGFADITTVEIDPAIARRISEAAARRSLPIRVVCQKIEDAGAEFIRPYGAVLTDPPCNPAGLAIFLDGARRLTLCQPGSKLFLSTHFLALGEDGYGGLLRTLAESGYRRLIYEPAFNRYPIPRASRMLLNAMLRVAVPGIAENPLRFFVSDLVVLEYR
jgi:hypothetical protein